MQARLSRNAANHGEDLALGDDVVEAHVGFLVLVISMDGLERVQATRVDGDRNDGHGKHLGAIDNRQPRISNLDAAHVLQHWRTHNYA